MTNDSSHNDGDRTTGPAPWNRRGVLQAAGASALGAGLATLGGGSAFAAGGNRGRGKGSGEDGVIRRALKFPADGRLRIVQFNDTQDSHRTDTRTTELQNAVLDEVEPHFVVINGDVIDGGPTTVEQMKQAINNVVLPMEERTIPWALTFGNHDEDSTGKTGFDEADMIAFISQYKHNLNTLGAKVTGSSNQVLTVSASSGKSDAFAIWLLDSGRYAPEQIAGQEIKGYPHWDWLRFDQVEWYARTSRELEKRRGSLVPGLVFQHIALHEHRAMWFDSIDSRTDADHRRGTDKHSIVGERNEDECPGPFNSGMFTAMLHRGDIRGLFVGHDHINSYTGNYFGIELGYSPGTGFAPYGLPGADKHRLRGARVFTVDEGAGTFTSELRLARDYGIDMDPAAKPGEPAQFPDYVK
ncbi:putative phosphoesterase [Brevibacterium sanguinis]|uniref:Phosphoesterase n=2 Tax=Brevibacterium TaxID=1696 RepID=A0ABX9GK68_9MICO|nr:MULTISPECIES: metallophosphoesterase family protein [Brevibacterium]RBP61677.1 putative phosphoesterase [Brevibacterium sanguinis]RBP74342.1 putative phosphoesterase [Brevibacterium celere]